VTTGSGPAAATRTQRIVERVRLELEDRAGNGLVPPAPAMTSVETREAIIRETLMMVGAYAESLNSKATQVSVSRMIIMITAAALGRLSIPFGLLHTLDKFAADINVLVYSPNNAGR
jgi:hypothetical protein